MNVVYKINQEELSFNLEGNVIIGKEEVLYLKDIKLLENSDFETSGYKVLPFLDEEKFTKIQNGITKIIYDILKSINIDAPEDFKLEDYHNYVDDEKHLEIAKIIQHGWHVSNFPIDFGIIDNEISKIINFEVTTDAPHINFNNFFVRIIRPSKTKDNNPPHRDVWIDRLRNCVNIYYPICGSDDRSSLPIIPGTHLLSESLIERSGEGAKLNGTQFTVPCVIKVNNEIPNMIRPDVQDGEIMIFTPYLVHGGGANLNQDKTRVSLEVRFFPKNIDLSNIQL